MLGRYDNMVECSSMSDFGNVYDVHDVLTPKQRMDFLENNYLWVMAFRKWKCPLLVQSIINGISVAVFTSFGLVALVLIFSWLFGRSKRLLRGGGDDMCSG